MNKFLALIALAMLPLTALAHGPSPQKVEKTVVIKAAPAKVWAIVKDFGNMQTWNPNITAEKTEQKKDDSGEMATFATLTLKSGGNIVEKLRSADDAAMKLKYEIVSGTAPVADYNSFMTVTAGPGAGESTVTWVGRFYRTYKLNPPIPAGQDDETAVKFVTDFFDTSLTGLKKAAENSK
jgi:Polyketide cyclase / dehydrase and lipid transport